MAKTIIEQMIERCKNASVVNRGAYRVTAATNVYNLDGSTLEEKETPTEPVYPEEPDITVNPSDPESNLNDVIASAESGNAIAVKEGTINTNLSINKSITLMGELSGISQNKKQEIV